MIIIKQKLKKHITLYSGSLVRMGQTIHRISPLLVSRRRLSHTNKLHLLWETGHMLQLGIPSVTYHRWRKNPSTKRGKPCLAGAIMQTSASTTTTQKNLGHIFRFTRFLVAHTRSGAENSANLRKLRAFIAFIYTKTSNHRAQAADGGRRLVVSYGEELRFVRANFFAESNFCSRLSHPVRYTMQPAVWHPRFTTESWGCEAGR